eukprot:scaffold1717_cov169-Amphora_coffeaeformis.AAC.2
MEWGNLAQYIIFIPLALFLYVVVMGLFGPKNKEQVAFSHWNRANKTDLQRRGAQKKNDANKTFAADCDAELRALTITVKRGCTERKLDGVLVVDKGTAQGLAIQYYGTKDKKDTDKRGDDTTIQIEFILTPTEKIAKMHLREKMFETVPIDSNVFDAFKKSVLVNSEPKKEKDKATKFTVFEGILP